MKTKVIVIILLIAVVIIVGVIGLCNYLSKDEYMIAYVLNSSEYNLEDDMYNLSLYVPDLDETMQRQMSGIYYREYNIQGSQICIDFNEELDYIWIVSYSYCEE